MSRIGNRILEIPKDTTLNLINNNLINNLTVSGPKGSLEKKLSPAIKIIVDLKENTIRTTRNSDKKEDKQLHGTTNSLISNMLKGVSQGFIKELEINGVGYRAAIHI